jgi:hypothetical protein
MPDKKTGPDRSEFARPQQRWHRPSRVFKVHGMGGHWRRMDLETGLFFPNLNNPPTELTQTNKILPEPCDFLSTSLPQCSVIRPTLTANGGAVATVKAFSDDGLFKAQNQEFFTLAMQLAVAADSVKREF